MWGWADTKQMTKKDLKSLDVFAFGLVWAGLLTKRSVITHEEGVDPPKFRLLEILRKVDRPTDADLWVLGFSEDVARFVRCVLADDLEAVREEMACPDWPQNKEQREAWVDASYIGIREWVRQHAVHKEWRTSDGLALIEGAARFSYRERPTVEELLGSPYFDDLRNETPPKNWQHREAPHFEDVREALEKEQGRQRTAMQRRAQALGASHSAQGCTGPNGRSGRGRNSGAEDNSSAEQAEDAFIHRIASNATATIEQSVRNVCDRVRAELDNVQLKTQRHG